MSDPTRSERPTRTPGKSESSTAVGALHGFYPASKVEDFPYAAQTVCYLEFFEGELYKIGHYVADRREAARRAVAGDSQLVAIWPGEWRSDAFLIDEPALFAAAVKA